MTLPDSVKLCECWTRDGLQSMPQVVSTEHKIEMIHRIVGCGIRKLEIASFSHPKLLPHLHRNDPEPHEKLASRGRRRKTLIPPVRLEAL